MKEAKRINPDIRVVTYGKKELKDLKLYPLSIGDQFKVTDIITEIIQSLVEGQQQGQLSDYVFMAAVMSSLEKNLGKILALVADIPEDESNEVISELTNSQFVDIVESVWEVDFEPALKKGKNLFGRAKSVFSLKGSSPSSSSAIHNTDLKTSTGEATDSVD